MIRINLLKSLQVLPEVEHFEDSEESIEFAEESRSKGRLWIVIPVILILSAGIGMYLAMRPSRTEKPAPLASPDTIAIATPVPDTVKTGADTVAKTPEDPDPSRRITFQYFAGTRLFQDLQTAAAQGVGFTRIMFTPPDEFYVHGVASTEADLQHFKGALIALPGATLQQDQTQPVGAGGVAREFHFSGRIQYDTAGMTSTENRVLAANQVDATLKEFISTTHALGIELEPIQLQDSSVSEGLTRLLYRTEANCDYARLQTLLEKLQQNRSHVGFQRVNLEAQGNEKMTASLDLLVYAR